MGARRIVCGVEVGAVNGAGNLGHLALGEPAGDYGEVLLSKCGPSGHALFKIMLRQTEANKLIVGNVV